MSKPELIADEILEQGMNLNLNNLLKGKGIDPKKVIVMRHRPYEPELNKVLP